MEAKLNEIRKTYIETPISQRELALRYGASLSTIAKRSAREGWYHKKCEKQNRAVRGLAQNKESDAKTYAEESVSLKNTPDPREQLKALTVTLLKKTERAILSLSDTDTDTGKLRQLVQSVKDLRDIVKSNASASDVGELENIMKGLLEE